jgi:hypothetical protein
VKRAVLDGVAERAGFASRIGREAALSDGFIASFLQALMLGDGAVALELNDRRPFLDRWCATGGIEMTWRAARSADAPGDDRYAAIVAVEPAPRAIRAVCRWLELALEERAGAVVTLLSENGGMCRLLDDVRASVRRAGFPATAFNATGFAVDAATRLCVAALLEPGVPQAAKARAAHRLASIADGRFAYGIVFVAPTRRPNGIYSIDQSVHWSVTGTTPEGGAKPCTRGDTATKSV